MYRIASLFVFGCLLVLLGQVNVANGETPGERFRKQMEQMAAMCVTQKLSPTDSRCILPKMKPADPLATEEGRFAHSIKIPNPVPENGGYKSGMTPEQYFDHLCKTEAGEFIYKTVENVDGLYLMRPREVATDFMHQHLYAMEDPAGYAREPHTPQDHFVQPPLGKYKFLEMPASNTSRTNKSDQYIRHYRGDEKKSKRNFVYMKDSHSERVPYIVQTESTTKLKSHYGYTWRGIGGSKDRDLGVSGGELIVLDLTTAEVLAVRRVFFYGDIEPPRLGFVWKRPCPLKDEGQFISKVLKPAQLSNDLGGHNAAK
jgi:hypothetical protein